MAAGGFSGDPNVGKPGYWPPSKFREKNEARYKRLMGSNYVKPLNRQQQKYINDIRTFDPETEDVAKFFIPNIETTEVIALQ